MRMKNKSVKNKKEHTHMMCIIEQRAARHTPRQKHHTHTEHDCQLAFGWEKRYQRRTQRMRIKQNKNIEK